MTLGIGMDNEKFRLLMRTVSRENQKELIKIFRRYIRILSKPTKHQMARKKNAN